MEEIKNRIRLLCLLVIAWGCVDEVAALVVGEAEDGGRGVDVAMQDAVRHVHVFPWLRRGSRDGDQIGDGYQIDGGARVVGIKATIAIGFEVIAIDLRGEGLGGDSPDAG